MVLVRLPGLHVGSALVCVPFSDTMRTLGARLHVSVSGLTYNRCVLVTVARVRPRVAMWYLLHDFAVCTITQDSSGPLLHSLRTPLCGIEAISEL